MNKPKLINDIYFDEVSEEVDDWLTTYLNFNSVDLTVKPSSSSINLIVKYRGRGSYVMNSGIHVSTQLDYGWYVSLLGSKSLFEEDVIHYEDVSISIQKTLLGKRKITIHLNNEKGKGIVLYGSKVILTKLVSEDATYNELQRCTKPASEGIGDYSPTNHSKKISLSKIKFRELSLLVPLLELLAVLLISYIVHRFVYGEITTLEAIFVYGFIGFLVYVNDLIEKIGHIAIFLIAVALFSTLPYLGFAFAMICIYLLFLRKKEPRNKAKTDIFANPKAKDMLINHLRKIGQIKP